MLCTQRFFFLRNTDKSTDHRLVQKTSKPENNNFWRHSIYSAEDCKRNLDNVFALFITKITLATPCCFLTTFLHCYGSGSALIRIDMVGWIWIRIGIGNAVAYSVPEGSAKMKKGRNFKFWSAGCHLLRAEGFSCSLDVLYGGLGISCNFFSNELIQIFDHQNPGTRTGSGSTLT
jgi:hypothetical protein